MMARAALSLAWSAALALLAYPAQASVIGQQRGILGGDDGFFRPAGPVDSITLNPLPYTRTVACDGYVLSGVYTGTTPTWSASPSGESGTCTTGGNTFACGVLINPDAVGEGIETVTVSAGTATATATIGIYAGDPHTCLLAQDVNGDYNNGLSDLDAVGEWVSSGSGAINLEQVTGSVKPTLRTNIIDGSQPVVRFDGGDELRALSSVAADWAFIHDGSGSTVEMVYSQSTANLDSYQILLTTQGAGLNCGVSNGLCFYYEDRNAIGANERNDISIFQGSSIAYIATTNATIPTAKFSLNSWTLQDIIGNDIVLKTNGASNGNATIVAAYPGATNILFVGGEGARRLTGDVWRIVIYDAVLSATQQDINEAVDEWALADTFPVTP